MIKLTPLYIKNVDEYKLRDHMMKTKTRPKFNTPQRKSFHQAFKLAVNDGIRDYYKLEFMRCAYEYASPVARMAWNLWRQATDGKHHTASQVFKDNVQLLRENITLEMRITELEAALLDARRKVPKTT